jgi:uncharacterized protein YcbX
MIVGTIKTIYRYPVKSMGGEEVSQSFVDDTGVLGDRVWTMYDQGGGGISGAKRYPGLMQFDAKFVADPTPDHRAARAEITMPDGTVIATDDPAAGQKISAVLGVDMSLLPVMPADQLDHYRRDPSIEFNEEGMRALFARTPDEPLPDLTAFPAEIMEYESPLGTHFDAFPLMMMTQSGMDGVQARSAGSQVDVRRFRPNFLIETVDGKPGHAEADWSGKKLQIGELVIQADITCPRCIMTTHGFKDLPKDPKIMRSVVQETGGDLGIYAAVVTPGVVKAGDDIVVIDG